MYEKYLNQMCVKKINGHLSFKIERVHDGHLEAPRLTDSNPFERHSGMFALFELIIQNVLTGRILSKIGIVEPLEAVNWSQGQLFGEILQRKVPPSPGDEKGKDDNGP